MSPTTKIRKRARGALALTAASLAIAIAVPTTAFGAGNEWLTGAQRSRADQIISVFENATTAIRYDYAEALPDGRGVTAGRAGFTTNDGDALQVIQTYTNLVPGNPLARFIPELQRLAADGSGDTSGLPEADYISAWKQAAQNDPVFRQVQDDQVNQRYFTPAMQDADNEGLHTALARAELYDASIQHGNGGEYDALPALIARTDQAVGTAAEAGEATWLNAFLDVRKDDLLNPENEATQKEWSESVDRVEAIRRIAQTGNYDLNGPFQITAFDKAYTIN
ncbi:chitosanase [Wenjunlia tyrosinilytica]|uniref:Chitosanase n=1 Tax=Wenjunlia tyrosinilytica TaxID=1544741 RepID=A0A917ZW05_9ACTN|nr:chitosanase [Wenjunlia tyrosinilytica]GGO97149.1 chitosanase [Wenjunlia tyrosinilytica]